MGVTRSSAPVSIRLLGLPEVVSPKGATTFPSRGYFLLALLAMAPAQTMTRAQAAAQLWDNEDAAANLTGLRQLIRRMQKAVPDIASVLAIDDRSLRLQDAARQIDVCRFLELGGEKPQELLPELVALYRGDLLDGIEVLTRHMTENVSIARNYLRERYFALALEALNGITHYGLADPSPIRAVERHMLTIDGAREESYRALIKAYGAVGRPEEAKRIYGLLTGVLHLDGIEEPLAETRVSLARATTRTVEFSEVSAAARDAIRTRLPRVALLAPNWVASHHGEENLIRSLVEDIANELARHKSVTALAAHSSFLARHDGGTLLNNDLLRADYTVTSFVRPGRGMGTICVRLVNVVLESIVWSGEFPLEQKLLMESRRLLVARIAAEVSRAVESDSLGQGDGTGNPSSYLMYLRAQRTLKTCDLKSVRRARRLYTDAIRNDQGFAEAYSGISCSLYLEWLLLGGNDPKLLAEARDLAGQAIRHQPASSSGYWREAMVALYQHDFERAERSFEEALQLHPHSADILLDYSDALGFVGDPNEAWRLFERAIDLNPAPPDHYWWAGASIAFSKAEYGKAIELCRNLQSDESVLRLLAACHGQLGNREEAKEFGRRLMEAYPGETAESMTRLQPHRSKADLQPFIDGLRMAGIK